VVPTLTASSPEIAKPRHIRFIEIRPGAISPSLNAACITRAFGPAVRASVVSDCGISVPLPRFGACGDAAEASVEEKVFMPRAALPLVCLTVGPLVAIATGAAVVAQERTEAACHSEPNTGAVNACLAKVYADLDVELNAAYKSGFMFIDKAALQPNLSKDWKRAYQDAQRKWIAFREADCGPPVSYEWSGGSATGAMQLGCKIARTRERLATLKQRYAPDK
jgi:uncharacterized protein YecT (DUF1311 family)